MKNTAGPGRFIHSFPLAALLFCKCNAQLHFDIDKFLAEEFEKLLDIYRWRSFFKSFHDEPLANPRGARHAWDIPLSMGKTSFHVAFYAKLCFLFAGFFTAQSLLAFYYRLIQESGVRWFRIALHCSVVFNLLAWLPFVFTEIFVCV